jgi:molybdate transport system substrate-binding protein
MSINHRRRGLVVAGILGFLVAPLMTSVVRAADVTVFAAASLKNALDDAAKLCQAKTGAPRFHSRAEC